MTLYRDILGSAAWDALPAVLRDLHERGGDGTLTVTSRGLAKVLSTLGFAPSPVRAWNPVVRVTTRQLTGQLGTAGVAVRPISISLAGAAAGASAATASTPTGARNFGFMAE